MPETDQPAAQNGAEIPDWVKAMGMEGMYNPSRTYDFEPSVTEKFVNGVKDLSRLQYIKTLSPEEQQKRLSGRNKEKVDVDKEIERQREKLLELREEIFVDQINIVGGIQFEMLGFQSPFPYETKYGLNFLNNLEDKVEKELTLKRSEKLSEESKLIFKEMRETVIMTTSMYHVLEGLSSSMKAYYDGELEANSLYSMYRRITGDDLSKIFERRIGGASLTDEEKSKLIEFGYLKVDKETGEVETYKEKTTRLTSDAFYWNLALASAAQWDYTNNTNSPRSMALSENELKFIQYVFGNDDEKNCLDYKESEFIEVKGKKIPKSILTWFAMEGTTTTKRETFQSLFEVLLKGRFRERLAKIAGEADFETQAKNLVYEKNGIREMARIQVDNFDQPKNLDGKLLTAIFNQNIIMANGFMMSGDLCWRYDYSLVDGLLKRKTEIGTIYNTFDVPTIYYWIYHKILYDGRAEDRSTLMVPSVGAFRKMFEGMPPHFKLDIIKYCQEAKDEEMLKVLGWIMEGENPYENNIVRGDGGKFGRLNEKFVDFFKKNVSAFLTPFWDHKDDDNNPIWLSLPVPIPGVIDSINFFRGLGAKGSGLTYFERLLNKEDIRDLNWKGIPYDSFDTWRVNTAQMHKWLIFLIGTHELDRDKFEGFKQLFEDVRALGIKKLDKTGRLGTRSEREKKGIWNLAFAPFLIALSSAKVTGIWGRDFFESPEAFDLEGAKKKFKDRISDWVNTALDLPKDADELDNFNGTMAFMIMAYGRILLRISSASKSNYGRNQAVARTQVSKMLE